MRAPWPSWRARGGWWSATPPAPPTARPVSRSTPTARATTSPASPTPRATSWGSCPIPRTPSRPASVPISPARAPAPAPTVWPCSPRCCAAWSADRWTTQPRGRATARPRNRSAALGPATAHSPAATLSRGPRSVTDCAEHGEAAVPRLLAGRSDAGLDFGAVAQVGVVDEPQLPARPQHPGRGVQQPLHQGGVDDGADVEGRVQQHQVGAARLLTGQGMVPGHPYGVAGEAGCLEGRPGGGDRLGVVIAAQHLRLGQGGGQIGSQQSVAAAQVDGAACGG